jgi:4-diphosphocytidyl-2-C-methyl-D-erythritol kinase
MDLRKELKRTARAPAKLNLFLDLLGRRDDGFHEVETIMVPVRLADTVTFAPFRSGEGDHPGEILLDVYSCPPLRSPEIGSPIPTGPENLVVRALKLLQERSGCELSARVELVKRIPAAAGLGGGSSDAAAALRLANTGWHLQWSDERLAELAGEIGSDVPFFLSNGAALCRGRGERIERLPPLAPLDVVIVKPPVGLNTGEVYRAYSASSDCADRAQSDKGGLADIAADFTGGRIRNLGLRMRNALQKAASSISPWVDKLRMAFNELDFVGHQLSGSGSAYFGVCRHAQHARRLANILRTQQLGTVYATRSCQ